MGGCFSAEDEDDEYTALKPREVAAAPRDLAPRRAAAAPPPRDHAPRGRGDAPPPELPSFSTRFAVAPPAAAVQPPSAPRFASDDGSRGGGGGGATRAAARPANAVFCACGGPGARVKLLPCGHAELCLSCAQVVAACPLCGTDITDSIPSFRAYG